MYYLAYLFDLISQFHLLLSAFFSIICVNHDFAFLSLNFTKEGNSEGVNGSYAHQKVSITFSPSFSIDRVGKISLSGGFNIVSYYVQDTGYVSINW